jgi:hypothetical protein
MTEPGLLHVLDIEIGFDLDLPNPSLSGDRAFLRASGGRLTGSGIEAEVDPQAGDWSQRQPDGTLVNDQRIWFTLPDGRHIYMRSLGFTRPDGWFHCTPRFDTEAGPLDWLTRTVFLGTGHLDRSGCAFRVYRLED